MIKRNRFFSIRLLFNGQSYSYVVNTKENDLPIMKGIGVRYAYYYNTKHKRVGHVFQDRFRSEPVKDDHYILAVMRYIHNNPVKARIVIKAQLLGVYRNVVERTRVI